MSTLYRHLHPQTKILDEKKGLIEYIASDETLDSYREIVRADGWLFDRFSKNAPFVDSHNYWSIDTLLGKVLDYRIEGRQLITTVQWAIDVEENALAKLGWGMTVGGYLKAVSVGFIPVKRMICDDSENWRQALAGVGQPSDSPCRVIYLQQQLLELSSCILGANPSALAKAYKAGVVDDAQLNTLSAYQTEVKQRSASLGGSAPDVEHAQPSQDWWVRFEKAVKRL